MASDKTGEVEQLTEKLSKLEAEKNESEEELQSKIKALEDAASSYDVELGGLRSQVENQKAALLLAPDQIEEVKVEAQKACRADPAPEKDLMVIMSAAISGGYTMAINDCKAGDPTFDTSRLKDATMFNLDSFNLFNKYLSEFQHGVGLDAKYVKKSSHPADPTMKSGGTEIQ